MGDKQLPAQPAHGLSIVPIDMGRAALVRARKNPVFQCWWTENGACACPAGPACEDAGKHPLHHTAPHGHKNATQDPATIRRWWRRYPKANIAMPTGEASGWVVVDTLPGVLPKTLPPTFKIRTGVGWHLYYRWPGHRVPNRSIKAGGVDCVRGDGGYVLLPPSIHVSGRRYRKVRGRGRVAAYPAALLPKAAPAVGVPGPRGSAAVVRQGSRTDWLWTLACATRHHGVNEAGILALLRAANATQCVPPKAPRKLEVMAKNAAAYAIGPGTGRWPHHDFICPLCEGAATATFKPNRYGEVGWLVTCWGACRTSRNGTYLPDLAVGLKLDKAATKDVIVGQLLTHGRVAARLPTATPEELTERTL